MQRRKDAELYKTLRLCVLAFENDARDGDFFFDFCETFRDIGNSVTFVSKIN